MHLKVFLWACQYDVHNEGALESKMTSKNLKIHSYIIHISMSMR
jgi:hypothetical protein